MIIYLILFLFNISVLIFFSFFEKKINLYDIPDNIKKLHDKKVSLLGGIIFFLNISIYLAFTVFIKSDISLINFGFESFSAFILFLSSISILFILGIFDDKVNLSPTIRILILILVIISNILINPTLNISTVRLTFLDTFSIGVYSHFWTLLCFLLFINAFNFFDGINLQCSGLIFAMCLFFLYKGVYFEFALVILISNIFFSILNYSSKTFLGNNGSFFIPFIFGSLFIGAYNNNLNITADEIVILMLIPGLDLFRLFFQRIKKKQNPFRGDREHIHHYLLKKNPPIKSVFIIQLLIWIPLFLSQIFYNLSLIILGQIIFYTLLIIKYRN